MRVEGGNSSSNELAGLPRSLAAAVDLPRALEPWEPQHEVWFGGVRDSLRGLLAAMLVSAGKVETLLVIVPQPAEADILASDLEAFGVQGTMTLPLSAGTGDPAGLRDHDRSHRLHVLQMLRRSRIAAELPHSAADPPVIVCASVAAAMQAVPRISVVDSATRRLDVGQKIDIPGLSQWLVSAGFQKTTAVHLPGEFAVRGGILDVFPVDHSLPLRIELFDDLIESIRFFDPASQRSTERCEHVDLSALGATTIDESILAEYLVPAAAVLVIEPEECRKAAEALRQRVADPQRFAPWEELLSSFHRQRIALAVDLPAAVESRVISLPTATVDSFTGELDQIRQRIDTVGADHLVIVVADTAADAERMSELLRETHAASRGRLRIVVADLSSGFRLTAAVTAEWSGRSATAPGVLVFTGAELFHRSPVRRTRVRSRGKPIDSFSQLEPGDLVVHLSHGIGLYRGVERIEKNGQTQEHLVLEFDEGTKLFVPAHRMGLIQRYVGGGSSRPRLAKIGGQSWSKHRHAAQRAVEDMAAELLEIQASRKARAGISFDADSDWQKQFDASFPYIETIDQLSAIDQAKNDMETSTPMDRLICGDVGFGKTEVAMRAAFKAVDSGYQVAVLVPTTILAEQHYHTFRQRMAEFPVDIARLNRFADSAEQRQTRSRIKGGQIDIVIGTHRLAGEQVEFFNLGLVIIDEEHRFGVAVKERLKAKHSQVDVLTLSATPIPRTLHMALVGVRDISNLETPPAERLSVETHVVRWDEALIRRAVIRELNRGGQIFFVHNRIADIHGLAEKIQRIVPEIRIGIGHGRMDETELEQVMIDFIQRKYDLLLATTIIESGLDIPNANTIFVDEADRYGLADLHQLRGRVGRYKHQAYCYMLVDRAKYLTPEAAKRLRAIEEFSQMGAGFAISMRDLEIRGAGNLLGTQQSGHIAAVGYEMYCQLLEEAVRRAQHLPPRLSVDVDIDLPVAAFLPPDYVPDMRHKIDLYRRIAKLDCYQAIDDIEGEMVDRFGTPPPPTRRLLEVARLRLDAAIWQVDQINSEREFIVLHYRDRRRVEQLKRKSPLQVRIVDDQKAYVPVDAGRFIDPSQGWLEATASVLRAR